MSENNNKRNRTSIDEEIINLEDDNSPECPMCGKAFPAQDISLHVHFCLQKNQYKRSKQNVSALATISSNKPSKSPKLPVASKKPMFNIFSPKSSKPETKPEDVDSPGSSNVRNILT
jgi:hypothetical protein